jgi:hypothetical protein
MQKIGRKLNTFVELFEKTIISGKHTNFRECLEKLNLLISGRQFEQK